MRPVGVPNILSAQRFATAASTLRQQSEAARAELATGRTADLPAALGASIGESFLLRGAVDAIELRRQGLAQAALVSSAVQRSLSRVGEGARAIASDALGANGRRDDTALGVSASEARSRLQAVFSSLNIRLAGQSLFAGDASDRPALSDFDRLLADVEALYAAASNPDDLAAALDGYFDDPSGRFRTTIYSGGLGDAPDIEIDKGERLRFTLRADDASIRDLIRGLSVIAVSGAAPASSLRDGALAAAAGAALNGAEALTARQAEIGVSESRAAAAIEALDAEKSALTEAYNARTTNDPLEIASRLQSLESQLGAAYAVTARLSQLTLANFLR